MNDSSAGQPHDQDNPFAAPQVDATALPSDPTISDAERVRCEYIAHEVSLKSSGLLYYIGGGLCGIYSLWLVCFGLSEAVNPRETEFTFGAATVFFGAIAVTLIVIGRGLRKLKPWIRIPVGIVSVLGLLGFPCVTLISVYVLYLVISAKATFVVSPQYQSIVAQTPHVRFRTSAVTSKTFFVTCTVLSVYVALAVALVAMVVLYY